jgi:hypothetical protein
MKTKDIPVDVSSALIKNGPKFKSHNIICNGNVSYLKATIHSLLFCVVYIVVGLFLLILAVVVYVKNNQTDLAVFLGGFGVLITAVGFVLLKPCVKRVVFDKKTGRFISDVDQAGKIANIASLQVVNKMVTSKHGISYPCYELNLLTKNGCRINILNHNDLDQLKADAENLSEFLSVELMDLQREIVL